MSNFYLMYRTLGTNLCAGRIAASSPDTAKASATGLLERRRIRRLEDSWIEDEKGTRVVVLNMSAYLARRYEWLTIR